MALFDDKECFPNGFTCFWTVENFHLCKQRKKFRLVSQTLNIKMLGSSKWFIELTKVGGKLCMFLCKDAPPGVHIINFFITILTKNGWLPYKKLMGIELHARRDGYGSYDMVDWKELFQLSDRYLLKNSLTVCCHIWNNALHCESEQYFLESHMTSETAAYHKRIQKFKSLQMRDFERAWEKIEKDNTNLATNNVKESVHKSTQTDTTTHNGHGGEEDLKHLMLYFDKMDFGYVTLRTQNKDFIVLKAVICAASDVFTTAFDNEANENKEEIIEIADIDHETMELFVKYIHHEHLQNYIIDWKTAVKLYRSADKYLMQQLKIECTSILKESLTTDNICDLLIFSDDYANTELRQCAEEYFCKNSKNILCSEKWKTLLFKNTDLAAEILKTLAESL